MVEYYEGRRKEVRKFYRQGSGQAQIYNQWNQ